jgi:site-specific recombinase XerD
MTLAEAITTYVDLKQSMGMRFRSEHGILKAFHRRVGDVDLADVTPDAVAAFLAGRGPITATWLNRHRALRRFYEHWITRGRLLRSPMPTAVPRVAQNFVPHVYSNDELRRLLAGVDAHQARPACQISAHTFRVLLLLLYGAGLRISEALTLTREDVDVHTGLMLIRESKFYTSRQLPLGPTLMHHLVVYADEAPRRRADAPAIPFFATTRGTKIPPAMARLNFAGLRQRAGVHARPGALTAPRLHDLRHSFAVNRLVAWYREGADVQRLLPQLSTYLGHRRITSTQRYLTMIPDLLEQASLRFETYTRSEARDA